MSISSLGIGSGILTQDVLDQLRGADEAAQINPIDLSLADENDKKDAMALIDSNMTNLADSIGAIKDQALFDERSATVTGTSVEVIADANTDLQDFSLNVTSLATKQIEQSGAFSSNLDLIAEDTGSLNLNIDGQDFTIDYDETTTLDDLKNLINDTAGDKVDATVVQISSGEFRLFISSVDTGTTQDISITDNSDNLDGKNLLSGSGGQLSAVQTGEDANFTFNGQDITRTSNNIDDLIVGLNITLKEVGESTVQIEQNRENITLKIDNFIEKYNTAMLELDAMTKPSTDSAERGIFSNESTIKSMKNSLEDMMFTMGGGAGYMSDYGFDIDKDGILSVDKDIFNTKMDQDPSNVEAFLSGGTFKNNDGTTVELDGAFTELHAKIEEYTKYNATLDQFANSLTDNISSLEDRRVNAVERLDTRYGILAKQYAAYDAMIARLNSDSDMFTQLANESTA